MSELHGHVKKLWSGPTPETVYKMNVPYVPGDNCPICAQPITIDRNIDGSSDWSCILCGWRREKSPAKLQDYLPGQLTTMNKPGEQGKTKRICTDCKKTFLAFPVSLQTTCGSCRSAAQTRKHRRGADADRRKYFTVIPGVISELLKVKGESQHVLEKALGVYNGAATLWNSGKYGISEGHLNKAAAYFGVDRGKIAVERTGKDPDAPHKAAGLPRDASKRPMKGNIQEAGE